MGTVIPSVRHFDYAHKQLLDAGWKQGHYGASLGDLPYGTKSYVHDKLPRHQIHLKKNGVWEHHDKHGLKAKGHITDFGGYPHDAVLAASQHTEQQTTYTDHLKEGGKPHEYKG